MIKYRRRGIARVAPALAVVALAALASPGAAQQPTANLPGTEAEPPTKAQVKRSQLFFVGASVMKPFTDWTMKDLQKTYDIPDPVENFDGTSVGFKKFCDGVGAEFPDVVGATRPMRKDEFDACQSNGVFDIIEVRIGESAISIVAKKGNPVFNITPRMLYLALAAEVPKNGEFEKNKVKSWNEVTKDKAVPALPIKIFLPDESIGQRGFFDDRFLQGGCRHITEIDAIFGADERVQKCITLRKDVVTELSEPIEATMLAALKDSAPGTIGVIDLLAYKQNPKDLELLPVAGVIPSSKTVDDYSYLAVNPLIFYFKRAHMRDREGRGVVRGIREFMAAVVSEPAVSANGAFAKMGLEPFSEEELAVFRTNVRRLRRYER